MKTDEVDMLTLVDDFDKFLELVLRDTELVFIKTCGLLFVRVGIDIRVDTY